MFKNGHVKTSCFGTLYNPPEQSQNIQRSENGANWRVLLRILSPEFPSVWESAFALPRLKGDTTVCFN